MAVFPTEMCQERTRGYDYVERVTQAWCNLTSHPAYCYTEGSYRDFGSCSW